MAEPATKSAHQLQIRKVLPASADEVFDAWINPKSLEKWMRPGAAGRPTRAELDLRVGGAYRIEMFLGERGYLHTGTYRKVQRPRLLEFTWISEGTEHQESIVTIELIPRGKETELVLTHRLLPSQQVAKDHECGWAELLDNLAAELSSAKAVSS